MIIKFNKIYIRLNKIDDILIVKKLFGINLDI